MKNLINLIFVAAFLLVAFSACQEEMKTPKLAFGKALPEKYNSPDGMTIGADGCIYLSMTNVNKPQFPAKIIRITKDDKIEEVIDLLPHPKTGVAKPLGIVFGADGNLYISDNQSFASDELGLSRIFKVTMNGSKAVKCEVVAEGFNMSNGITTRGNAIFVAETNLNVGGDVHKSGVYRFNISELNPDKPVQVTGIGDPHLISVIETKNKEITVGANGLAFNSKGELFVCNFGDAEVLKVLVDESGKVTSTEVFAAGNGMVSVDGMQIDKEDNIWIADFLGNAVVKITPEAKVVIVAKNENTDGANGELDAPSECIRRGDKVYVSNIDLTFGPNTTDDVHTMSIIELE
jgi:tRNA(Ser,Leu) C12 N-acetylase TAN1